MHIRYLDPWGEVWGLGVFVVEDSARPNHGLRAVYHRMRASALNPAA